MLKLMINKFKEIVVETNFNERNLEFVNSSLIIKIKVEGNEI